MMNLKLKQDTTILLVVLEIILDYKSLLYMCVEEFS